MVLVLRVLLVFLVLLVLIVLLVVLVARLKPDLDLAPTWNNTSVTSVISVTSVTSGKTEARPPPCTDME